MDDALDLDADDAKRMIEAGTVQCIDVREPYEWDAGRIAGARHIPLDQLATAAGSDERPILFYCRVGGRSGVAAAALRRAGYRAYSLSGGLVEWDRRGFALDPHDGSVADH